MRDLIAATQAALARASGPSSDHDLTLDIPPPPGRKLRPAAVLMAIQQTDTGLSLILTKRASALRYHPGQISFPGGAQDSGDPTLEDAALREAEEEIGLPRAYVEILGRFPNHETITGFQVSPVVARITRGFDVKREVGEVDEVFTVPLAHVLDPAHFVIQSRRWRGIHRRYYTVPYGPYYIWGATARILRTWTDILSRL